MPYAGSASDNSLNPIEILSQLLVIQQDDETYWKQNENNNTNVQKD